MAVMIKLMLKLLCRMILHFTFFIPVNNRKIVFDSFSGKQISCNPYYIYKYMKEHSLDAKYVWVIKAGSNIIKENNTKYIKYNTLSYILNLITAKVVIYNDSFPLHIPTRKNQILINTWHGGGAYKKIGLQENGHKTDIIRNIQKKVEAKSITYFLSSSSKFTEVMSSSNLVPIQKYLPYGMPRNDIFFDMVTKKSINIKVRNTLNLDKNDYLILYAPTFRGTTCNPKFDLQLNVRELKNTCFEKYGKRTIVAFRGHHTFKKGNIDCNNDFDLDLSDYPDMQELLVTADMLITDYSSSMWDFSFTHKLCILFTPDIDCYLKSRGFYTSPYTWGFPIVKTNNELNNVIRTIDYSDYQKSIENHHKLFGSYENGQATDKIFTIINQIIK